LLFSSLSICFTCPAYSIPFDLIMAKSYEAPYYAAFCNLNVHLSSLLHNFLQPQCSPQLPITQLSATSMFTSAPYYTAFCNLNVHLSSLLRNFLQPQCSPQLPILRP
jgi:hypothetical protein